jgi:CHAT domain-containing protein
MKKKWTKAQYGRERYLATEFLKSKSEQMNESVWSLPKGATTTSVDELDAELSRAGIKSNPDFTKLLVQVSGNKSKINKIMKTHKAKKIFEGKLLEKKIKPKQKMSKKDWRKIAKFNKHIGQDGTHYVMQLTNKGTALVPVTVEQKIREQIREIIEEQLNEKKETNFQMNTRDMREVDKLLKKGKFKGLKMKAKGPKFILTVPKKMEDKVLSYLIQKNIKNINEV